jgi:hypothetical protein
VVDVDAKISLSVITPNNPAIVVLNVLMLIMNTDLVIDFVSLSFMKTSPITPMVFTPPIVHSPRDFSCLQSNVQNPWSSLHHHNHCSYQLHTYQPYSHPVH